MQNLTNNDAQGKRETNMHSTVQYSCVFHDSRISIPIKHFGTLKKIDCRAQLSIFNCGIIEIVPLCGWVHSRIHSGWKWPDCIVFDGASVMCIILKPPTAALIALAGLLSQLTSSSSTIQAFQLYSMPRIVASTSRFRLYCYPRKILQITSKIMNRIYIRYFSSLPLVILPRKLINHNIYC